MDYKKKYIKYKTKYLHLKNLKGGRDIDPHQNRFPASFDNPNNDHFFAPSPPPPPPPLSLVPVPTGTLRRFGLFLAPHNPIVNLSIFTYHALNDGHTVYVNAIIDLPSSDNMDQDIRNYVAANFGHILINYIELSM